MSHIRVRVCPTCQRRRRLRVTSDAARGQWHYRCSQGHTWIVEWTTLERGTDMMRRLYAPVVIEQMSQACAFVKHFARS